MIEADDMDIAYGMSATFLFDTIMIVVFPLLAGGWDFLTLHSVCGRELPSMIPQAL